MILIPVKLLESPISDDESPVGNFECLTELFHKSERNNPNRVIETSHSLPLPPYRVVVDWNVPMR